MIEIYEKKSAKMETGFIDHIVIDVKDIKEIYQYINQIKLNILKSKNKDKNTTQETILQSR